MQVFLCHSSGDKERVRELYQRLRAESFNPWLDTENILAGQDWEREIRRAIKASGVVLICLSRDAVTKEGYVQKEVKLALDVAAEKPEGTIFIIPLLLEPCEVPDSLSKYHRVDYFQKQGFDKLRSSLRARQAELGPARPCSSTQAVTEPDPAQRTKLETIPKLRVTDSTTIRLGRQQGGVWRIVSIFALTAAAALASQADSLRRVFSAKSETLNDTPASHPPGPSREVLQPTDSRPGQLRETARSGETALVTQTREPPVVLLEFPSPIIYRSDSAYSGLNKLPTLRTDQGSVLEAQVQDIEEGLWLQSFREVLAVSNAPTEIRVETTTYPSVPKGNDLIDRLVPGTRFSLGSLDGLFNIVAARNDRGNRRIPVTISYKTPSNVRYQTHMMLDLNYTKDDDGVETVSVHVSHLRTERED